MNHVAIMKKSWGLIPKIVSGKKTIESRWYLNKSAPWNKITKGDSLYFKNSGEPIKLKTKITKVIQFSNLTQKRVKEILNKYGDDDGIELEKIEEFFERFKNKKYCVLIFVTKPTFIRPFDINKSGFGSMSAWITVPNISKIKK